METKNSLRFYVMIASIGAIFIIAFRLLLPIWFHPFIEKQVVSLTEYQPSYSSIDMSLLRGSYSLENFRLEKNPKGILPFFTARKIEFSISWSSLLKGKLTGKITVFDPNVNFIEGTTRQTTQNKIDDRWTSVSRKLLVIPLEEINVIDGVIRYKNLRTEPTVDLAMTDIYFSVKNINDPASPEGVLPSRAKGTATIDKGKLRFVMDFNARTKIPVFSLRASLYNLDLSYLSNYLQAYGNYEVEDGLFGLTTQASSNEEKITGFVRPLFENINLVSNEISEDEYVVRFSGPLTKSFRHIPFESNLEHASLSLWSAIGSTLHSALMQALMPIIKNTNTGEQEPSYRPSPQLSPEKRYCL
jgi:hypothetical protein